MSERKSERAKQAPRRSVADCFLGSLRVLRNSHSRPGRHTMRQVPRVCGMHSFHGPTCNATETRTRSNQNRSRGWVQTKENPTDVQLSPMILTSDPATKVDGDAARCDLCTPRTLRSSGEALPQPAAPKLPAGTLAGPEPALLEPQAVPRLPTQLGSEGERQRKLKKCGKFW